MIAERAAEENAKKPLDRFKIAKNVATFGLLIGVFIVLVLALGPAISKNYQEPMQWPQMKQFLPNDTIKFDVGGTHIVKVEYDLLLSVDGSKLQRQFSKAQSLEENGTVFINRPYAGFINMIDFLRNSRTIPTMKSNFDQKMFLFELEYWQIPLR